MARVRTSSSNRFAGHRRSAAPPRSQPPVTGPSLAATLAMLGLLGVSPAGPAWAQQPAPTPTTPAPSSSPATPAETPKPVEPAPASPAPAPATPVPAAEPPKATPDTTSPAPPAMQPDAPAAMPGTPGQESKDDQKADPAKPADPNAPAGSAEVTSTGDPATPADSTAPENSNGGDYAFGGGLLNSAVRRILPKWLRDVNISGSNTFSLRSQKVSGGREGARGFQYESGVGYGYEGRKVGPFYHNMDVTLNGQALGIFRVDGRLSNQRYGNYFNDTFGIDYDRKGTKFQLGTVNAALPGNSFVTLSKSLQGLVFGRDFGGGIRTTNILSITKASTRRGSFQGNGTTGPYYVGGSLIFEGSERIRINGRPLRRADGYSTYGGGSGFGGGVFGAGTAAGGFGGPTPAVPFGQPRPDVNGAATVAAAGDGEYIIDYYTGQITFRDLIPPESTVEYSYESQSYNNNAGFLAGTRWDYNFGAGGMIGLTWLQQKANGGGSRGEIEYRSPVFPDPAYIYYLPAPIDPGAPVRVWFKEQEMIEGRDFKLDRNLHHFRLITPLPPDTSLTGETSLRARYKPLSTQTIGGDRRVMGLDGNVPLGKLGNVNLQFGQSKAPDGRGTGQAMRLTTSLKGGGRGDQHQWTLNTILSDIGAGFSGIDSVDSAFLHAEKTVNTNLTYSPNRFFTFATQFNTGRLAQQNYGALYGAFNPLGLPATGTVGDAAAAAAATPSLLWTNNQNWNFNAAINLPNLPSLTFAHTQVKQTGASTSTFSTDRLDLNWSRGIWRLGGSLGRTSARGRTVFGNYLYGGAQGTPAYLESLRNGTAQFSQNNSSSDTARFDLSVTPWSWLGFSTSYGTARTSYGQTTSGSGIVGAAAAATTDNGRSNQARDFSANVSMRFGTLSLQGTFSDATNGRSTASYYGTTAGTTSPSDYLFGGSSGQRTRSQNLSASYQPLSYLQLSFDTNRSLSLVPGYDNTESASTQFGFVFTGVRWLQLSGSLGDQSVTYVGNQGDSSTRSYDLAATVGPFGRFSLTSAVQRMNAGASTFYNTSSTRPGGIGGGIGTGVSPVPGGGFSGVGGGTGLGYNNYLVQNQNLTVVTARASYDLGSNRSLYFQWQGLDTRTPLFNSDLPTNNAYRLSTNSLRSVGTIGMEFRLSALLGVSVDMNLINLNDRDNPAYSYNARTMNVDLTTRF